VTSGGPHRGDVLAETVFPEFAQTFPRKYLWFLQHNYSPHVYQAAFHAARTKGLSTLTRFRHLVAGRRGGKTLSAAWETLFYALHPEQFHMDVHGVESSRPLWIWALAKDYKAGRPSLVTFLEVIRQVNEAVPGSLIKDKHFRFNKTERIFEFLDGAGNTLSTVEFKSADDPQSLRGAGLDILWIDEAAFLPNKEAWHVVLPALADKEGVIFTTTTPHGKNWFYEMFFTGKALEDVNQFRVEYTSIDNPYFPRKQWTYYLENYHPVMFRQEFMAAFDAFAGIALQGDWLHYYVLGDPEPNSDAISVPRDKENGQKLALRTFIGVDPAISLSEDADYFAMSLIGITRDSSQAFLLDYYVDRIPFPDQLDKIREWFLKYRPEHIGIESNAFQRALVQMTSRMEGLPGIVPVFSKSKKEERILGMGPLFKIGKVRIHAKHVEFMDQWVSYDPEKKNQEDDLLDSVEIALGVAGVLLPGMPDAAHFDDDRPLSMHEEAMHMLRRQKGEGAYIPELGVEA